MNTNFKIVNDDYGIDLSIEIDKAIKRGEKPSVIEQIKKYKEQQKNMSRSRQQVYLSLYTPIRIKYASGFEAKNGKDQQAHGQIPILSEPVIHTIWRQH